MARQESDREDLMAEATALVRRVELTVPGEPETVVAGERTEGRLSIYFGPDPVHHFDEHNRLRRAFVEGLLYRTQGDTLARLTRVRSTEATELRRHDLTNNERDVFLATMRARLARLRDELLKGTVTIVRQVPEDDDFIGTLTSRIEGVLQTDDALAPPIKGKRN